MRAKGGSWAGPNITLYQGKDFINLYKNLFDNHYKHCLRELLLISMVDKSSNASNSSLRYLGVTDPDNT